jgi:hypothetical protein
MSVNLSAYRAIQPVLFVQLDIPGYQILRFSDFTQPYTLNGVAYTNIGQLLSVSDSSSELRVTETEISVSLSGIPPGSVAEILNNNPKGSEITIQRGFFTPGTTNLLPVAGNPAIKFKGLVSNYAMDEEWDTASSDLIVHEAGGLFIKPNRLKETYLYNRQDVRNLDGYIILNRIENLYL